MTKYIQIFIIFLTTLISCKSAENINSKFKQDIKDNYPSKSVCFRIDKSKSLAGFGLRLFNINGLNRQLNDSLLINFESGENCDLVALTDKMNDSIIVAVIYPFKSDIEQSFEEYPNWYYRGKIYLKNKGKIKSTLDTITIEHNPPIVNPWLNGGEKIN